MTDSNAQDLSLRLQWAIATAIARLDGTHSNDADETAAYIAEVVVDSGYILQQPKVLESPSQALSIDQIEAHPLYAIIVPELKNLLDIKDDQLILLVEDILDSYDAGPPAIEQESQRSERIAECELCERTAPLTVHHLLPRSEHRHLSRKGFYTLDECRSTDFRSKCAYIPDVHHRPYKAGLFMQAMPHGSAPINAECGSSKDIQHSG